jgi:hypothetical protein
VKEMTNDESGVTNEIRMINVEELGTHFLFVLRASS